MLLKMYSLGLQVRSRNLPPAPLPPLVATLTILLLAGLLCVAVQPFRQLCGVRWDPGDHPGGDQDHVAARHLRVTLRAPAAHLQDHQVASACRR